MSSMLDQAILDAQQLREAALRNAESAVVEKYSDEVRKGPDLGLHGIDNLTPPLLSSVA